MTGGVFNMGALSGLTKVCTYCNVEKPIEAFYVRSDRPTGNGRSSGCRDCLVQRSRAKTGARPRPVAPAGMARCARCEQIKPKDRFCRDDGNRSGCASWCKACFTHWQYHENPERRKRILEQCAAWDKQHRRHPRVLQFTAPGDKPSAIDLAWIAGFVDAEGSFSYGAVTPTFTIYNNERAPLDFIASKLGGSVKASKARPDQFALTMTNKPLQKAACEAIEQYLVIKKEQCRLNAKACVVPPAERVALKEAVYAANGVVDDVADVRVRGRQVDLSQPTPEQWAYLAGYLEGDGTFTLQRQTYGLAVYYYAWVIIYSVRVAGLAWINNTFGGTLKFRKRCNRWRAQGEVRFEDQRYVKDLLSRLLPYLKYREPEARLLLEALALPTDCRQPMKDRITAMHASTPAATPTNDNDNDELSPAVEEDANDAPPSTEGT